MTERPREPRSPLPRRSQRLRGQTTQHCHHPTGAFNSRRARQRSPQCPRKSTDIRIHLRKIGRTPRLADSAVNRSVSACEHAERYKLLPLRNHLGKLLHFCRDIETDQHAPSAPELGGSQARPPAQPDPEVFGQLIRGVQFLSEIACLIEDTHARLPDGPEKERFEIWRRDVISRIHEAMSRAERVVASLPRKDHHGQRD